MSSKGKLYLIPNYLSAEQDASFMPPLVGEVLKKLEFFIVENVRTSRRCISSLKLGVDISSLSFEVLDKRFDDSRLKKVFQPVFSGKDIGLQSEAGLPCIADPGNIAVAFAHRHNIEVVPLPGASSIILGLISSGFNGQSFTFHGYLPINKKDRDKKIKEIEQAAHKSGYTQLFMEAPYRNDELMKALLQNLHPDTLLFLGSDITGKSSFSSAQPVKFWKKGFPRLHKIPTIFGIGKS